MKQYQVAIIKHLGEYARRRLGVFEEGTYKRRSYAHILPARLRYLNALEAYRAELQDYLSSHEDVKLHQFFHHLNSSQAFTFNLFFPYFRQLGEPARALSAALGIDCQVLDWSFEYIADKREGTNVDVTWRTGGSARAYCEVKLSEREFGATIAEEQHYAKLETIYRPQLEPLVTTDLLHESEFFRHYQLLRNISLLAADPNHQLILLVPRENEALQTPLTRILSSVVPSVRPRITVAFIEDCISALMKNSLLPIELRVYAAALSEKYVVPQLQEGKSTDAVRGE